MTSENPPEQEDAALFEKSVPFVGSELLEDILCILAKQNDEAVRNPKEFLVSK